MQQDQHGAGDVIALQAGLAVLVLLDASGLLGFAVKLLDLPAHTVHFLYGMVRILNVIIGDNPVRDRSAIAKQRGCFYSNFPTSILLMN